VPGQPAIILLSKEGVTQGDPLAMALYGIALLPLAEILRAEEPSVMQPWFADDSAMQGRAPPAARCFPNCCKVGPHFGYHPEPEKLHYICPLADEAAARAAFEAEGYTKVSFCRGHRYVGGFVGSKAMRDRWIEPKIEEWVHGVKELSKVAQRYPQTAYAGFTQSLQSEWQYISRCVAGSEEFLQPGEDAICEYFLPAILQEPADNIDDEFRTLLGHGVKQGGITVRNPTLTASRLFESSEAACAALVGCLLSDEALDLRAHVQCVRQASTVMRG
jgi:hypothetical protein